jgi:hypothetical protein
VIGDRSRARSGTRRTWGHSHFRGPFLSPAPGCRRPKLTRRPWSLEKFGAEIDHTSCSCFCFRATKGGQGRKPRKGLHRPAPLQGGKGGRTHTEGRCVGALGCAVLTQPPLAAARPSPANSDRKPFCGPPHSSRSVYPLPARLPWPAVAPFQNFGRRGLAAACRRPNRHPNMTNGLGGF